ncbi:MAG TPA: cytochrome c-type biogenesis protein CcmH [Gaiellales bacterium]|nr:cytochrome c-type biogenesis protein CcmH [Gaiellales bacterium]
MRLALVLACLLGAAMTTPALAAQATWSEADLESQLMCPVCHTLLDNSQSAEANRIRQVIHEKHQQGWSEARTRDYLVVQYGEEVLAAPPRHGFDLLAWLVPAAVLLGGAALAVLLARAWSGGRGGGGGPSPPAAPDAEMDARIDAELAREET